MKRPATNQRCFQLFLGLSIVALSTGSSMAESGPASFGSLKDTLSTVERLVMPPLDIERLKAEDVINDRAFRPGPTRFAAAIPTAYSLENAGNWSDLADGGHVWRLRIHSRDALSINLGLADLELPTGARLWAYDPAGEHIVGPYSQRHLNPDGQLWLPVVLGDELILELQLPAGVDHAHMTVASVNHGYRFFGETRQKQGSCNIDVICPEVDPYRDQVRAVARYIRSGTSLCTGNLVNNTAQDGRPLFLTADHCGINSGNASSVVVYWNFESPTCGALSGGSLANNQTGATFLSSHGHTDFALIELNQVPDPSFDVFYAGWDASGATPQGVVGIHHPAGDEKAAAFDADPQVSVDIGTGGGETHWEVSAWDTGTTEGGSSGSCIFDRVTKACVGTLTGGFASCSNPDGFDVYGKFSGSWTGGGTMQTRLSDWLDPVGGGTTTSLQGTNPGPGGGTCVPDNDTLCFGGGRFKVEADWRDFIGQSNSAKVVPGFADDSANMWFFSPNNWELLIKVLNGCSFNDHFWVFFAATTDVEFNLTVTDTETNVVKTYTNPLGQAAAAVTDTAAFATCP